MSQQDPQGPLLGILTDLSAALKPLARSSLDLSQELNFASRANSESQAFRALEILIRAAYAVGLTQTPELQQAPAYREAVEVLRMGGKSLPADL